MVAWESFLREESKKGSKYGKREEKEGNLGKKGRKMEVWWAKKKKLGSKTFLINNFFGSF